MTTKKTTVLMAAILAVATVLAAGLVVLPGSVQEAQANPCAENNIQLGPASGNQEEELNSDVECEFYGPVDIEEP